MNTRAARVRRISRRVWIDVLEQRFLCSAAQAGDSTISGVVFNDLNANRNHDAGEPGIAGITVYLDDNQNGQFDPDEQSTVTADDGSYAFDGLTPGDYSVREVVPAGFSQTLPPDGVWNIDLAFGQQNTDVDFGNVQGSYQPVVGRFVFYNRSKFDGNNSAANAADDGAIATDKSALLPGQKASFANYTSYVRGINGIMVDVKNLPDTPFLDQYSFTFKVGGVGPDATDPSFWNDAPDPQKVLVRRGEGVGGSDRIEIVWPDNAIRSEWLQVTVRADPNTGLVTPDVFYFGNAPGESGNDPTNAQVTAKDEAAARADPRNFRKPADVTNAHDYNRDGRVDATDQLIARNHATTDQTSLQLLDLTTKRRGRRRMTRK
jgi:hypothetical protein